MGSGIAQVAAQAGHPVFLFDQNEAAVARGHAAIAHDLRALAKRGRLNAEAAEAALARVQAITDLAAAREAGLAIEAIFEDLGVKQQLFASLEALLAPDALLASNTSSLSITAMASALRTPSRLAGMHFFNPAPRMALVEIVSGLATDPAVADTLHATALAWGKVAVHARSTPGFIVNRVARPYYAEALRVLTERAATPATLDALLREGCGFAMGPFALMDLIGHDVNFAVTRSVFEAYFGDPRFTPSLIQQELVRAGRLGRKSGQGFYDHRAAAQPPAPEIWPLQPPPQWVRIEGDLGPAQTLAERLASAGLRVERCAGPGQMHLQGGALLSLSDGRSASARAAASGQRNTVLFDLALDYTHTPRLGVTRAVGCQDTAFSLAVGALQAAGIAVSVLDDVPGLIGLRTLVMLANEAADAVLQGVASATDVDAAMRHGTNYPLGPLAWAERLGWTRVVATLDHLAAEDGTGRYRVSPWLRRQAWAQAAAAQG